MPKYIYYDRRTVSATSVQFFHESRSKHSDKEFGTNMEKDAEFPVAFTIKKIVVQVAPILKSTTVAKDATLEDEIARIIQDMIIELQVGDLPVIYLPLDECLGSIMVDGALQYTLATAADGSYAFMSIGKNNGEHGYDCEIPIPAGTMFKFFIKSLTTPALGKVLVKLIGEKA
jgi:hypothetical protein